MSAVPTACSTHASMITNWSSSPTGNWAYFEDHDELYFNAIGHGWTFPIDQAVTTVTLPFQVPPGAVDP